MINALILSLFLAPSVFAGIGGLEKIEQRNLIFRQEHEESLRSGSVTCPELGNKVFTSDPPFNILGKPDCGKTWPKLRLYLPVKDPTSNSEVATECDLVPFYLPNQDTTSCLKELESRQDIGKVVLIIHGYKNDFNTKWLHEMQQDIQQIDIKKTNVAVIIVGWGEGAETINYWKAARDTRYTAYAVSLIVKEMHQVVSSRKLYVHCIGHSLGAQTCGLSGKDLIQDNLKYDRISGLDPAGPLFCTDVESHFFNYKDIDPRSRLERSDAHFVDVIHTDGMRPNSTLTVLVLPKYGTMMKLGTVDFYPGHSPNYGHNQPGCSGELANTLACSHSRSHELYAASIKYGNCKATGDCTGESIIWLSQTNLCMDMNKQGDLAKATMGYWTDLSLVGTYTVDVTASEPYCDPVITDDSVNGLNTVNGQIL